LSFRAFIAVDAEAGPGADRVLTALRTSGADLKPVERPNLHLTLRFLGDTEESRARDIRRAMELGVQGVPPFEVRFRGLGVFPNQNHIRVVWMGLEGAEPLSLIAGRLDEELSKVGFGREGNFSPHLTVARVRSPRNRERLLDLLDRYGTDDLGSTRVERIILKKSVLSSSGPTYTNVEEVAHLHQRRRGRAGQVREGTAGERAAYSGQRAAGSVQRAAGGGQRAAGSVQNNCIIFCPPPAARCPVVFLTPDCHFVADGGLAARIRASFGDLADTRGVPPGA